MTIKLRHFDQKASKLFQLFLYCEDSLPWIRRQDNRFSVIRDRLKSYSTIMPADIKKCMEQLQDMGWIYNYREDKFSIRFNMRLPSWLTFSPEAALTERSVPGDIEWGEDRGNNYSRPPKEMYLKDNKHHFFNVEKLRQKYVAQLIQVTEASDGPPPTPEEMLELPESEDEA